MRITDKIMQDNALYNINNNKVLQDQLSTQMATQKKITRPSDDPVIAIRALRLRSNVSEITQFYERNVPDAESWLKVTEDALNTTVEVLTDVLEQVTKAPNKVKSSADLEIILEQLKLLGDEFYSTGGVDYAGRNIFTGYRTDTSLSYTMDSTEKYTITEQITAADLDTWNYVDSQNLAGITDTNYTDADRQTDETEISSADIHRIRLSYDKVSGTVPKITAADGTALATATVRSSSADPNPYEYIKAHPNETVMIPETGEILIGDTVFNNKFANMDANTEIRVSYEKENWQKGDLRPEHYFTCTKNPGTTDAVNYNPDYLTSAEDHQVIEYDVGYNQKIRVNTTADQVFTHDLKRDLDDMDGILESLKEIEKSRETLDSMLKGMSEADADYSTVKDEFMAADKAYTYLRQNAQDRLSGMITSTQGYLDVANIAVTENGTRSARLALVSNRLMSQQTTFKNLQSQNEDAELTEVTVDLTSAELTYNAALMATGKIANTSLMDYI